MSEAQVERALWLCALALLLLAFISGCQKGAVQNERYAVSVQAVDELGKPLPGLQLTAAGTSLGVTDGAGRKSFEIPGVEGQRVDLAATCPARYSGPRERPAFLLKHTRTADGHAGDKPIEVSLTCDANEHLALVAVQTGQAGLPIMSHGQVLGQTSETGTAHVMLREATGKTFQLMLDTSAKPELRPENPTHTFTVTQKDAFSVWDQPFEVEKKSSASDTRKKRKARASSAAASKRKPARTR
jgi:hypothetical protein